MNKLEVLVSVRRRQISVLSEKRTNVYMEFQ
jgi:hypothetical protein